MKVSQKYFVRAYAVLMGAVCFVILFLTMHRSEDIQPNDTPLIDGVFYINMNNSVARRDRFIADYALHPIPGLQPSRFVGVVVGARNPPPPIGYGTLGCSLGHARVLQHVSRLDPHKWYLVCEDDASGNFSALPGLLQSTVQRRSFLPDINVINLHSRWLLFYGLGTGAVAYLVTQAGAQWMLQVIHASLLTTPHDVALAWSVTGLLHAVHYHDAIQLSRYHSSSTRLMVNKKMTPIRQRTQ